MLEVLQYIFSSFWVFVGVVIILSLVIELISVSINNTLKTIIAINMSKQGKNTEEIDKLLSEKKEEINND